MELMSMDTTTKVSHDLYSNILLEGARLKDDQKKLVTMVADNELETKTFIKTLRTNYHDVRLIERRPPQTDGGKRGFKGSGKNKFGGKSKKGDNKSDKANYSESGPWLCPPDLDTEVWMQSEGEFDPGPFWAGFEDT